jgi:hypothetical protein
MVFNATFNNISVISWRSALLVEETGVPGENHRHVASQWQTLSYNIIYSYSYLESDLIKHCHVIFTHSLGQPLIVRSHSKVHRSRGNPREIPTWASRVSNYSYFPWFNRQQTWRPAIGSSLWTKRKFYILYRIFTQSRRYSITWCLMQKYSI